MKTTLIIALTLAASLAQAAPEDDCRTSFFRTVAFAMATEPVLDKCLANDIRSCIVYTRLIEADDIIIHNDRTSACVRAGEIDDAKLKKYQPLLDRIDQKTDRLMTLLEVQ